MNFDGLDFATFGAGHPPDTNGDVGPTYYIQTINTSIGIFQKSDGMRVAAFSFNTFMSQANFGDIRDTDNFGDPVVLYDTFEDRWVITDFAFKLDGGGNVINPLGSFQVIAVSKTGDPVLGGWNFYSINTGTGLGDYPKFGIWPDGLYMSTNMFAYQTQGIFQGARVYAFNKAQMYAGNSTVKVVTFNAPTGDFTLLPSNARLQVGTPPPGTPNYFVSTWEFLNALTVYKFHVDWNRTSLSTFTGPDTPLASSSWPNAAVPNALSQGGNQLDVLQLRAMVQNQYTNLGGVESLWATHTVRRGNTSGLAAPRWYQVDVTGGTVNPNIPQATTWDPDGANVISRFMPSLAVDRAGDMALGYSTSSSTTLPAIKYAGRLAADPINTFSQTEQLLVQGTGTQTGSCGGTCTRWGDYSAMTLDPDGCTMWYTNMYYAANGLAFLTRIGSFKFAECTPVGNGGTISGTVTATIGGAPLSGAKVDLGARSTTTNGSGFYSFSSIPAGTYPGIAASLPGYTTGTASSIVVTDAGTTTQNFSLGTAATSVCLTDTTQADFQTGAATNVDLTTSPGDVILVTPVLDQLNPNAGNTGVGITTTTFGGQTFTPAVTGKLRKVDVDLFCSGCGTGTQPNLTLSVRATSGGLPTGADLATAPIAGFNSGAADYRTGVFSSPVVLNAGTMYALVVRPDVNPTGTYALLRSGTSNPLLGNDVYSGGTRVSGATSGTVWSIPTTGGITTDAAFRTFMDFAPSGNLVSSVKDSNPLAGLTPVWSTLSWSGSTPANTTLRFQIAATNSNVGPFNFVGPDGTAGTFFTTSPATLDQFYGLRYLQYKAYLDTSDTTQTPTLNDVTVCYNNTDCTGPISITPTPAQVCANSTGNTASGPAGATSYAWSITNGTITSVNNTQSITYTAGASGSVGLMLNIVEASGCHKTASTNVTINPIPATPTITPGGPTTFCAGGSVTLTSSSATGNQWFLNGNPIGGETNQNYIATTSGDYTVTVTTLGCTSAASSIITVTVNPIPATPTITPGGPTTFCTGGSVTLTSSSGTGNQWSLNGNPIGGATNQMYSATASGDYTVVVTSLGCSSSPSAATSVTVNPIPPTPTITPGGPTTFCTGGSVTLTSSSASGNQWCLNGNQIGGATSQMYVATASGNYTVKVTASGCTSASSAATTVTVNPIPATPTITPGGPTTFCPTQSVTLSSSSGSGNQWYLNGNPIGGATNPTYVATASGTYTDKVTALGCTSPASNGIAVTVSDSSPPTINCPANQMVTSPTAPVPVTYPAPTVGDNCPGVGMPTCTPPSGSSFPAGTTTVTCNVSDFSNQSSSCQFTVTVVIPCNITCPANINKNNDPNQCGAVNCSPASGSFFPKGTTTVNCTTTAGPSCSFTVTVNDTQPPVFTACPAGINRAASATCPFAGSSQVTYTTPAATDNCSVAGVVCNPPSGGMFPVGTTTVTCTATDTSSNTAICSFPVSLFSLCVQDDTNAGNVVLLNVNTGAYRFCCNGVLVAAGTGILSSRGCVVTITDTSNNRNAQISIDGAANRGNGSIKLAGNLICSIQDRSLTNNTCVCQ
jgi:hypothetical protein